MKYLLIILFSGLILAQEAFDSIKLKSGSSHFGEYIEIIGDSIIVFTPNNSISKQYIKKTLVSELRLKNGQYIIGFEKKYTYFSNEKVGNALVGLGGLLIASNYIDEIKYEYQYSDEELEQLSDDEYVVDEANVKRRTNLAGALLIAFGSFIQLFKN